MYYSISFPADFNNIPPLRELVYRVAILEEFTQKDAERLKSVVDELCNNAIEWGSQATSEVLLEVYSDDQHIKITCRDHGHGNKLTADQLKKLLSEPLNESSNRGRGLRLIVKSFVDELNISNAQGGGLSIQATLQKKS